MQKVALAQAHVLNDEDVDVGSGISCGICEATIGEVINAKAGLVVVTQVGVISG